MITRDVEASALADLALSPPRAALAADGDDGVVLLPVQVTLEDSADPAASPRIVQVPQNHPGLSGRDVVVIADDGPQWFRLRSLIVRGLATAIDDCTYRIVPRRIVAWDYGALREVPGPPALANARQDPSPAPAEWGHVEPFRSPDLEAAVRDSRVMIVASRSRRGTPFAVPLWLIPHHGRLYATTSASSWSIRNVDASPQVTLLLGGEQPGEADRLVVRGHARAVRGMPPASVLAQMAWRYYAQPRYAAVELAHLRQWPLRVRYYGQSRPAYLEITPQGAAHCRAPRC